MNAASDEAERPSDRSLWSEEALVEAAKEGDKEAFAELYRRYEPSVRQCAQRILRTDGEIVDDIVQEAFLHALRALPEFRGESKFSTWLIQITHNLCVSRIRKERTEHGSSASLPPWEGEQEAEPLESLPMESEEEPEEVVERKEMQRLVRVTLSSMPHHYRFPIVLRDLDGRPYREIAHILRCTVPIVKARLHRARSAFKARLLRYLRWTSPR